MHVELELLYLDDSDRFRKRREVVQADGGTVLTQLLEQTFGSKYFKGSRGETASRLPNERTCYVFDGEGGRAQVDEGALIHRLVLSSSPSRRIQSNAGSRRLRIEVVELPL